MIILCNSLFLLCFSENMSAADLSKILFFITGCCLLYTFYMEYIAVLPCRKCIEGNGLLEFLIQVALERLD